MDLFSATIAEHQFFAKQSNNEGHNLWGIQGLYSEKMSERRDKF